MSPVDLHNTTRRPRVASAYPEGRLELVAGSERTCDMPACHQVAFLRAVVYRAGRAFVGRRLCGFHGAALYGVRDGR